MTGAAARLLPLLLLAAAGPAADRPPAVAARDATLGYHLRPATGEPIDVRVGLQGGGARFRVDLPDTSYLVGEPASRRLTMVVPLERTLVSMDWAVGPQSLFTIDGEARFTRRGESAVAEQRCTLWDAVAGGTTHSLCVTADGLVLRNQFADRQGRRSLVEAFSVRREVLTDADFSIPDGFDAVMPGPGAAQ